MRYDRASRCQGNVKILDQKIVSIKRISPSYKTIITTGVGVAIDFTPKGGKGAGSRSGCIGSIHVKTSPRSLFLT